MVEATLCAAVACIDKHASDSTVLNSLVSLSVSVDVSSAETTLSHKFCQCC